MITPKFKIWLKCAGIRALKTVAQTAVATIGTSVAIGDVDWKMVLSTSVLAGLLSILTSIGGLPEADYEDETRQLAETRKLNGQDE